MRHFYLWKHIFALEVREKIEESVLKVKPVFDPISGVVKDFEGWSLMSLEIKDFTVFEVEKPKLGKLFPEKVLAEVSYSIVEMNANVKKEWEKLKPHDVIFLIAFKEKNTDFQIENELQQSTFIERNNITRIRGCELQSHLDEDRRKINQNEFKTGEEFKAKGLNRYLQVHLDPSQYNVFRNDTNNEKFNIAVRRNLKDLNFNVFLKLILRILETNIPVKDWIQQVIVGKANNTHHVQQEMQKTGKKVVLQGVFLDEKHYKETFSGCKSLQDIKEHFQPPVYSPGKSIRYTAEQIEAISRGILPGIHLVHGPPGTGKTEVCLELVVQALANFPDKRILIVSHSTSAIDDLFAKLHHSGQVRSDQIMKLGQSEDKSSSAVDFSRFGRINHMLKQRLELLTVVERLSRDLDVDMTNRLTCETAAIFFESQIKQRWEAFSQKSFKDKIDLLTAYPFSTLYFTSVTSLRKSEADSGSATEQETDLSAVRARLEKHFATIKATFDELERTRAMELLIQNKERGNYLMNYYSKVIGMTSSHFILKHEELLEGGFEAATVIFEEAGQIMDFGAAVPIALTKGVERIILIGDDNQLPPLVKNPILQTVANLQQSMFARLLNHNYQRVNLKQQGRCRNEIASLFTWKYAGLVNLPHVATDSRLNAQVKGVKHPVQFIDVASAEVSAKIT